MSTLPDLSVLMTDAAPREHAGSQTQARYDFQANFGILMLLELQKSGGDFRIIFDLFDDIMVVDSASEPKAVHFYQLKSKDPGEWTIPEVCKRTGKEGPRSIVSRLYAHVVSFGATVAETALVSNAAYKFKLKDGKKSSGSHHRIGGTDLHSDEIDKVSKAVTADIDPADIPSWLPKLVFIRTTLGVHDQGTFVVGHLEQHLEKSDYAGNVRTSVLYKTLHSAIVQRTTFFQDGIDRRILISRKSLTREDISELFARAGARPRGFVEDWEIIRADLQTRGIGSVDQVKLKSAAIVYLQKRNGGEANAGRLSALIRDWIENNSTTVDGCVSIMEIVEQVQAAIDDPCGYSELNRKAAMIVEVYEAINAAR